MVIYYTKDQHDILIQEFCRSLGMWIKSPKLFMCHVHCIFIAGASINTLISFTLCLNLKTTFK